MTCIAISNAAPAHLQAHLSQWLTAHGLQLPKHCVWELEMKRPPDGTWHTIHPAQGALSAVADRLTPGTKYIFRARAGALLLSSI